jgi:hypothetical protein
VGSGGDEKKKNAMLLLGIDTQHFGPKIVITWS